MADTLSVVRTVDDPLTAQRLVEVLQEAKIDAFSRGRGAAASGFEAASPGFWELIVPSPELERAAKLIDEELVQLEADSAANAEAAEEESMSGETKLEE